MKKRVGCKDRRGWSCVGGNIPFQSSGSFVTIDRILVF